MSSNANGLDNYAATLQERKRKEKEAKQKELQKMQEARLGGKSALDCMEDDDDDNVYDLVDDEEYAKIVKSRREESDFVVDDNGIGYADDGEEVVGVIEDAYDGEWLMAARTGWMDHTLTAFFHPIPSLPIPAFQRSAA